MIGSTISHYEVVEKLGEGGMGVVYKARDSRLKRLVALKVLPPEKVADPERKRRFVEEAQAASALNHPNIVTVHDIGQSDGVDFIAMEYVEGHTLGELIGRRGLKLHEALRIATQIADALAKAHAAGIVHRDLKPGNVMVTPEGRVKVLDFGLAKLTETALVSSEDPTLTAAQSTEYGMIMGTAAYMSPEQAEGKKVDARSDIFSFGSVLYEMLIGRGAFRRDNPALTLAAVLHLEPPPTPRRDSAGAGESCRPVPAQGPGAPRPDHGRSQSDLGGSNGGRRKTRPPASAPPLASPGSHRDHRPYRRRSSISSRGLLFSPPRAETHRQGYDRSCRLR